MMFHILSDLDEGKRSCRQKLERLNNRRRRKSTDPKGLPEGDAQPLLSAEDAYDVTVGVTEVDSGSKALEFLELHENDEQISPNKAFTTPINQQASYNVTTASQNVTLGSIGPLTTSSRQLSIVGPTLVIEVGFALSNPITVSGNNVLALWRKGVFNDGGSNEGTPSITFEYNGETKVITSQTIMDALHIPSQDSYASPIADGEMRRFRAQIG
ncbi:hypothetical protein AgCh_021344 [Apium graveolens]